MRMTIKKFTVCILAAAIALCCLGGCGGRKDGPYAGRTLYIYNTGEYTGEWVLDDFEYQTGCKVIQDEFESNEQMYIKVANGDMYDLLIPSDYMIERLRQEGLIQPLDKSRITCWDLLTDECLGLGYDPQNEYSVPYFWGTVGIAYDKDKVSEEDLEREGWNIFLDPKYKGDMYLYDSERDMFMVALKALGYSMNTKDEGELREAYDWLIRVVENQEPEIVTDEIIDAMAQGRKALGIVYSGDANYIQVENEGMGFYLPEEGTNLWCDAMVIPANAENVDLAYEYINFISQYDEALDNSLTVGYTSPNRDVVEDLTGQGGEYSGIKSYIPRADNPNDEVFEFDADTRRIMADLWAKVKIAASNAN